MARKLQLTTSEVPPTPEPGVYEGVSFGLYCQWPLLNQSTLKWGLTSPQHLKAAMDGLMEKSDTEAQRMGRALHSKLLEPDLFAKEWSFSAGCEAVIKSGQRKGEQCCSAAQYKTVPKADGEEPTWLCGMHAKGVEVETPSNFLSWDQVEDIDAMCEAMTQHPAIKMLRQQGGREVSLVWKAEEFPAKARLDKWIEPGSKWPPMIVDLKKMRLGHGRTDMFASSMRNYGYDIQAAWYVDAARQLTGETPLFVWVIVEESYPYAVNVLAADRETIEFGRKRYRHLLKTLRVCRESNSWPGYMESLHIQNVGLPKWFIERETEKMEGR